MERREDPTTHQASSRCRVPFDTLLAMLADPVQFPRLYPRHVARVERVGSSFYLGVGPGGDRFAIRPRVCRATGVIEVDLVGAGGAVEGWSCRIIPEPGGGCLYVHAVTRRAGIDEAGWEAERRAVDAEVAQARRFIERGGTRGGRLGSPSLVPRGKEDERWVCAIASWSTTDGRRGQ